MAGKRLREGHRGLVRPESLRGRGVFGRVRAGEAFSSSEAVSGKAGGVTPLTEVEARPQLVLSLFPGCLIDAADEALTAGYRWHKHTNGYARADVWSGNRRIARIYLHRLLMDPGPLHVDHINGDKLDNRRANLRVVTRSQNLLNRTKGATRHNESTGCRGVYVDRRDGAIYARVKIRGHVHNLGRFKSIAEADAAVRAAREALCPTS